MTAERRLRQPLSDVSRETLDRLTAHVALLKKWNDKVNLVSPQSLQNVWHRHVLDSAQLIDLAPRSARRWIDLGSGGGFPGLVCAILALERRPDLSFMLIDSDKRKCEFLRAVARTTGVTVEVRGTRVADVPPETADVVSARAVAPLSQLLTLSERFIGSQTCCLFPKGSQAAIEIDTARRTWRFKVQCVPSITAPNSVVLCCEDVERAG